MGWSLIFKLTWSKRNIAKRIHHRHQISPIYHTLHFVEFKYIFLCTLILKLKENKMVDANMGGL